MKLEKVDEKRYVLWINHQPSGGKEWVARIVGPDPKYKFAREFLPQYGRKWSRSGRTGDTGYLVEEGALYEANIPWGGRVIFRIVDGDVEEVSLADALRLVKSMQKEVGA